MIFHTKKPCNQCPFLKKDGIILNKERAQEIIEQVQNDGFVCHKTVDYSIEQGQPDSKRKQCGGSLILSIKEDLPNPFIRLHRILHKGSFPELSGQELIADTVDEFIKIHSND